MDDNLNGFEDRVRQRAKQAFPGPNYLEWLQKLHLHLKPRRYLEIGVASGGSLSRIGADTLSIGIDPAFNIQHTIPAYTRLYRETSDAFFESHDATDLLGGKIDLCFVDGLHTFDQTFRDIVNVADHCHDKSIVAVHDVAPIHEVVARRDRITGFWTGDVWKIGWMIKDLLPNVEIWTIPAYPSGLMILKNLNKSKSENGKLFCDADSIRWAELEKKVAERSFPQNGQELADIVNLRPTSEAALFSWMAWK